MSNTGKQTKTDSGARYRQWPTSILDAATVEDKIAVLAGEHGLLVEEIASRLHHVGYSVSLGFILEIIQGKGISWHPEFRRSEDAGSKKPINGPVTARIRNLVAVGYGVDEIASIIGKKESVILRCIKAARMGGYDDEGYFYIDPSYVLDSAMVLIDVDDGPVRSSWQKCWYQWVM